MALFDSPSLDSAVITLFEAWMKTQILQLNVDTLKSEAVTCTACDEILGTYIMEYKGCRFRYPLPRAYAFLKFIQEQATVSTRGQHYE
jgi:hypothetical protein